MDCIGVRVRVFLKKIKNRNARAETKNFVKNPKYRRLICGSVYITMNLTALDFLCHMITEFRLSPWTKCSAAEQGYTQAMPVDLSKYFGQKWRQWTSL